MSKTRRKYTIATQDVEAIAFDMRTINDTIYSLPTVNALEEHCREEIEAINSIVKDLEKQVVAIAEELGIEIMQ